MSKVKIKKSEHINMNVRIPLETYEKIDAIAKQDSLSGLSATTISSVVRYALKIFLRDNAGPVDHAEPDVSVQ